MRIPTMAGVAAVALLTGSFPASASATHRTSPPEKIVIDVVYVNGSGCPAGTAMVAVSPDNMAFTVTYSDYTAQAGRGTGPTDGRKNCQIGLRVHVPQGQTYAIAQADYRGYANIAKGASGLQRANYYFQGMPQTAYANHPLSGPMDDNWQNSDAVAALVYAPCGTERLLNVNTELRIRAGNSDPKTTSFMSMDSTDGNINTLYHFAWKKCPSALHH